MEMHYRPEFHLDRLRIMLDGGGKVQQGEPLLHLRWLRTIVVDLSCTPNSEAEERLAVQQRSAVGCAVERLVCNCVNEDHLSAMLPFLTQSVPLRLTSLDVRECHEDALNDSFLLAVANAHSSSLQRLYLQEDSNVAQSTLDRFTQLEELDATGCGNLTNVDFCSTTLRVLYANNCFELTDEGLRNATRLEVLHVSGCVKVTNVSPFAHCLLELDSSTTYGISSAALADCRRLQVLYAEDNAHISTLQPFATRLRELRVGDQCSLDDTALAGATNVVRLVADNNHSITTVEPFGASLRSISVRWSTIGDEGLRSASNLLYLDAQFNSLIHSLAPFATSLLGLEVSGSIDDAALSAASNLFWLNVSGNKLITSVPGRSLRHLVAWGINSALTNEGVSTATQLVTIDCFQNPNLTTIEPFRHSLQQLVTECEAQCLEVERAPHLHRVEGILSGVSTQHLEGNGFRCTRSRYCDRWSRNTANKQMFQ